MLEKHAGSIVLLLWFLGGMGQAAEGPKEIAVGEWSKPVADSRGYALRGRLVLGEKPREDGRREVAVYVELQDASPMIGEPMQVYCDFGKHDFRPEYKSGLQCELRNKNGKAVKPSPFAFSGAVPRSQWVTLPADATIRLRTSPFGIHRENALAICPDSGVLWVIAEDDSQEYFLSGKFIVAPGAVQRLLGEGHVWQGTIDLPAVRVTGSRQ